MMEIFRKTIAKTICWILENKTTRKLIEREMVALLENPETRKQFESVLVKSIIRYSELNKL